MQKKNLSVKKLTLLSKFLHFGFSGLKFTSFKVQNASKIFSHMVQIRFKGYFEWMRFKYENCINTHARNKNKMFTIFRESMLHYLKYDNCFYHIPTQNAITHTKS